MSRRPARFTQADITRAVKGVKEAGENMAVEILPNGTMRIVPAPAQPAKLEGNPWDR